MTAKVPPKAHERRATTDRAPAAGGSVRLGGRTLSLQEEAATKADLIRLALALATLQVAFVVVALLVIRS